MTEKETEYSKARIYRAEAQLQQEEEMLRVLKEELYCCAKNNHEEIASLREKAEAIRASMPDFDETVFQKYKQIYEAQEILYQKIKDADTREAELKKAIETRMAEIDKLKENICKWEEMLNKIDIPTG